MKRTLFLHKVVYAFCLLMTTSFLLGSWIDSRSHSLSFQNPVLAESIPEPVQEVKVEKALSPQQEVLKKVAQEEGMDWKILAGIFQKETQGDCSRIGDTHLPKYSVGCYQISRIWTPASAVSDECAMDLKCSSHWTAERLKRYAEKGGWDYAIAKHNGNPSLPKVQAYLQDVKQIIETL